MALESATYVSDLVTTNPIGGSDKKSQGDDHLRLIKSVLQATFPDASRAFTFGAWMEMNSNVLAKTANYSQVAGDKGKLISYDCSGGAVTLSLLAAATAADGFVQFVIKDSSAYLLTIQASGSETINGVNTLRLGPLESAILFCDGTNWSALHIKDGNVGDVRVTAAVADETGWLTADGSAISRTTYARLFDAICISQSGTRTSGSAVITGLSDTSKMSAGMDVSGTGIPSSTQIASVDSASQITLDQNATSSGTSTVVVAPFGVGDGSTTFNVPNLKGRAAIGSGQASGLSARRLGVKLGEEDHTLTTDEIPAHTHLLFRENTASNGLQTSGRIHATTARSTGGDDNYDLGGTTSLPDIGVSEEVGGDGSHNVMQPSLALNGRIKF